MYQPGLHILATLQTNEVDLLNTHLAFKKFTSHVIEEFELVNLGEVYYDFTPAGYTAVICLSESHISIHTWPEYQKLNLDIYLSNFQKRNNGVVENIFDLYVDFFKADISNLQKWMR